MVDWGAFAAPHCRDMVSVHSLQGEYLWASPSTRRILGHEPEALVGRNAYELFHPDDVAFIQKSHAANVVQADHTLVQYRIRCADGQYRWVESHGQAVNGPDGKKVLVVVTRDVAHRGPSEAFNL